MGSSSDFSAAFNFTGVTTTPQSNGNEITSAMGPDFSSLFDFLNQPRGECAGQSSNPVATRTVNDDRRWQDSISAQRPTQTDVTRQNLFPQPLQYDAAGGQQFALPDPSGSGYASAAYTPRPEHSSNQGLPRDNAAGIESGLDALSYDEHLHREAPSATSRASETSGNPFTEPLPSGTLTWVQRNQGGLTQESRQRVHHVPTQEEKDLAAARQAEKRAKQEAEQCIVDRFLKTLNECLTEFIDQHGYSETQARARLFGTAGGYKQTRKPTLRNAVVLDKARNINAGRAVGEKVAANVLQKTVTKEVLNAITKEEGERLIKQVYEHRQAQEIGMRMTGHACAMDVQLTLARLAHEFENLFIRTGAKGFAIVVPGHLHDEIIPAIVASSGMDLFFREKLKVSPMDFVSFVQAWVANKWGLTNAPVDEDEEETWKVMKDQSLEIIREGLRAMTGSSNLSMQYEGYDNFIVRKFRVELREWPLGVDFKSPSCITNAEMLRILWKALKNGTCKWVRQDPERRAEWAAKIDAKVPKKRKQRLDAGHARGANVRTTSGAGPSKAAQTKTSKKAVPKTSKKAPGRKAPPAISKAHISTSDEEGDEEDVDEGEVEGGDEEDDYED